MIKRTSAGAFWTCQISIFQNNCTKRKETAIKALRRAVQDGVKSLAQHSKGCCSVRFGETKLQPKQIYKITNRIKSKQDHTKRSQNTITQRSINIATEHDHRLSNMAQSIKDHITRQRSRQAVHASNCALTVSQHCKAWMHHFGVCHCCSAFYDLLLLLFSSPRFFF
jgi:hypothetical protein